MTMTAHQHHQPRRTTSGSPNAGDSFTSVYVDWTASAEAVRAAVAQLHWPKGVTRVSVDDRSMTDTFGCRIAIDLTGTFDEQYEGRAIARLYAQSLAVLMGIPAFALQDLLRSDTGECL